MTLAGCTLASRYDLLEQLGAGGFGSVYHAYDRELDEHVALKILHGDLATQPAMLERFRHEVKLARKVTHVNIARTFELASADGIAFCTMELVDGESLRQRLERQIRLSVAEAIAIARELCDGLGAAHAAGVVHRDIKPENVLIAPDGRVVLADFGVAAIAAQAAGDASGTPAYMAPEQARGEPATPAADIYAVGVILYEMVVGERAFTGRVESILYAKQDLGALHVAREDVPRELANVIARATAREPAQRIASAYELDQQLAACVTGELSEIAPARARAAHGGDLATVVVFAPLAAGDGALLHVADGVYEALLRRLVRRPRMRVLPRVEAEIPGALTVALHADKTLTVAICRDRGAPTLLELPLAMATVEIAADAADAAISAALDPARDGLHAEELVLRARQLSRSGFAGHLPALDLLEQARQLRPADPAIVANYALGFVRVTVLRGADEDGRLARARALVREALAVAPEAAESHVAAAQLELQTADAARAALHFRSAIACSPYLAEAHEGLGRLLLEAGFTDRAVARINDALAIAPHLTVVWWEIARDHALAGRWDEHDGIVQMLRGRFDRPLMRLRSAMWRHDTAEMTALRAEIKGTGIALGPRFIQLLFEVVLDGSAAARDAMIAETRAPGLFRRRRSTVSQLVAEVAGYHGDGATCAAMVEHAVDEGLYDLAWLERCPLIGPARALHGYPHVHGRVRRRAEAILDALYGDQDAEAVSDTLVL